MKGKIKLTIIIVFGVIGFTLLIIAALHVQNYPGMAELRHAAFSEVKTEWRIGLVLSLIAYILTYVKNKF